MADPTVKRLLATAEQQPETVKILDFLKSQKAVPLMETSLPAGENVYGRFTPALNFLQVAPSSTESDMLHELTHAAQFAMEKQFRKSRSNQFTEAYSKLVGESTVSGEQVDALTAKLDPKSSKQMRPYRRSPVELQAFAVADSVFPDQKIPEMRPPGPHVNATLATEFMILLDLADRGNKKNRKLTSR